MFDVSPVFSFAAKLWARLRIFRPQHVVPAAVSAQRGFWMVGAGGAVSVGDLTLLWFPPQVLREDLPALRKPDAASADAHRGAALQVTPKHPTRSAPVKPPPTPHSFSPHETPSHTLLTHPQQTPSHTLLFHHSVLSSPLCKAVPTQYRSPVALHIMIHRIVYYVYQPKIIRPGSLKIDT